LPPNSSAIVPPRSARRTPKPSDVLSRRFANSAGRTWMAAVVGSPRRSRRQLRFRWQSRRPALELPVWLPGSPNAGIPILLGDAVAAVLLAEAGARAAATLVLVNLKGLPDERASRVKRAHGGDRGECPPGRATRRVV